MSKTTYLGNNVYKHSVYGYRSDDRLKLDHGKDVLINVSKIVTASIETIKIYNTFEYSLVINGVPVVRDNRERIDYLFELIEKRIGYENTINK